MQQKSRPGIRVDAEAHRRAKEAGLCISRIASIALNDAADALERNKMSNAGVTAAKQTTPTITPNPEDT